MRRPVPQRKDHAQRLLHTQQPVERPLAVELDHRLGRVAGLALDRDDVLTCVVAFGRTGPEEKAAMKSCVGAKAEALVGKGVKVRTESRRGKAGGRTDLGLVFDIGATVFAFAYLISLKNALLVAQ